jgi:hypothetical protein
MASNETCDTRLDRTYGRQECSRSTDSIDTCVIHVYMYVRSSYMFPTIMSYTSLRHICTCTAHVYGNLTCVMGKACFHERCPSYMNRQIVQRTENG